MKKIKFGAGKTSVADSRMVRIMAVLAVVALGVAGVITSANTTDNASAADTGNIDFNLSIQDSLGLTVSANTISVTLDPGSNPFSKNNLTTTVGTNNENGYTLTVSATGTDLVESSDNSLTIPTLSSAVDEDAFKALTDSRWGYKNSKSSVSTTNYLPFASGVTISESETAVNADVANLVFATHVGYATAPGTYELSLNFTATATPGYQYMQDLNPSACVTTNPTLVIDSRDNKEYYIQRLADGKCWMLTNLNLAGGTKLYSETSDVPTGYPESGGTGYYTLPASSSTGFSSDTTAYVYNTGLETSDQSDCTSTQACNSYYSWLAAVAGNQTSVSTDGYNAPYSICPKGWRLPTATTSNASATSDNNWKTGDLYALATAYGANLASNYYDNSGATGANFYNNAGPGTTPNFLLAGYYYSSQLNVGGSVGYYWSSSSKSGTNAYGLNLNSGGVDSANNRSRRYGFQVRCVLSES